MRILCVTDSLNSGGAQRQMSLIARGLSNTGYEVRLVIFHDIMFFKPMLDKAGVKVEKLNFKSKAGRFTALRRYIRLFKPSGVLSFMNAPNLLNNLVKLSMPFTSYNLVVSERTGFTYESAKKNKFRLYFHHFANSIVTNSNNTGGHISKVVPSLRKKLNTIYNIVDFNVFDFTPQVISDEFRIVVVANYRKEKNIGLLIEALLEFKNKGGLKLKVDWYGNNFFKEGKPTNQSDVYLNAQRTIEDTDLSDIIELHGVNQDIFKAYEKSNALCLTSAFEGFPNVVCEAMASGRVVLSSNVSDVSGFFNHEHDGYIFEVSDLSSLVSGLKWLKKLSSDELTKIGNINYKKARKLFTESNIISKYEKLLLK